MKKRHRHGSQLLIIIMEIWKMFFERPSFHQLIYKILFLLSFEKKYSPLIFIHSQDGNYFFGFRHKFLYNHAQCSEYYLAGFLTQKFKSKFCPIYANGNSRVCNITRTDIAHSFTFLDALIHIYCIKCRSQLTRLKIWKLMRHWRNKCLNKSGVERASSCGWFTRTICNLRFNVFAGR